MDPADRTPVLLVTGASSGIGLATCLLAASRGWHVVLAARGPASLQVAATECDAAGAASTLVVPTDVGDDAAVEALVAATLDRHGRIDAVVSSAGVVAYGRTEEVPVDVFDGVLRTNLHGSVNLARHVVPVLRRQDHGTLVLVGSVVGHLTVPSMSPYVLSKWGVRCLVGQLRAENRDRPGVGIAYAAPGGVDTPIYRQAANWAGFAGRPPPPVSSAERAARQVLDRVARPRRRAQLTWANDVVRFGHQYLPRVYERIIETSFAIGATDLARPVPPTDGNVLHPREEGNTLDGRHGSALRDLVANARVVARTGRRPRS
ncbi:SDR family NAD(P)-dependent oxidoreductase [Nocardioides litoris]|uniref:SDR family NAD(P)-dependent oxidoreductase n=1 Tax=Nocardioides litoris TaxID=1926648 RepID=UPI0011224CA0|nr:SDR family NAD(P)-dependent oxidoreductase [Nocardioides litoris]